MVMVRRLTGTLYVDKTLMTLRRSSLWKIMQKISNRFCTADCIQCMRGEAGYVQGNSMYKHSFVFLSLTRLEFSK